MSHGTIRDVPYELIQYFCYVISFRILAWLGLTPIHHLIRSGQHTDDQCKALTLASDHLQSSNSITPALRSLATIW